MSEPRVFGWTCPNMEDDDLSRRYRLWFWLYKTNQQIRHRLGRHQPPISYSISPRCDWCGFRSPEQRAVARRNWNWQAAAESAATRTQPTPHLAGREDEGAGA